MIWTKVFRGTLDDIDFPETLYKYRDWNAKKHDRFIKNREIYLTSPVKFEDKKDCRNPIRYDLLTQKQCFEFYINLLNRESPNLPRQQRRKEVKKLVQRKRFKDKTYLTEYQQKYNEENFKRQGVLCLTAKPCLDKMWGKYAKNGQGFCVGYNSRIMFEYLGGGCKVEYFDELPTILPKPFMDHHQINYYRLYAKECKWEFEKEYRTVKFWEHPAGDDKRQIELPKEAFKEIILGDNISEQNRKEIVKAVRENIGEIPILDKGNVR